MIRVEYVNLVTNELHDKVNELYEAMMDSSTQEVLAIIKDIRVLCSDVSDDYKTETKSN
jgi:predicted protein tyrosine phosphatase